MLISTRGRYALRILTDLAENENGGTVTLREAAARQQVSEKYLESIVKDLVRGRLVEGTRARAAVIAWPARRRRSASWRS